MIKKIFNFLLYIIVLRKFEITLLKYQGYKLKRILNWINNLNLPLLVKIKILKNLDFYDAERIREIITQYINNNERLFTADNVYITYFGDSGGSGSKILYELCHSKIKNKLNIIESWKISNLPEKCKIIFVDDIIGTGKQSTKFINEKLNLMINPSQQIILFTLLATSDGINFVEENTNAIIHTAIKLIDEHHNHYSEKCIKWTKTERDKIISLNNLFRKEYDYDKGLLIAFYYSVPNNTMPIIWKEGYKINNNPWIALLPRKYGA